MAVDIRGAVSCSLGRVIRGSISDDSVIQAGLVRVTGSVLISGLITPAIGTAVTVNYVKAGVSRQVNRSLRVLSSFADPFQRSTSVKLGCKLTYLQDLKEPINWTALDDPANTLTAEDARIITLPIRAQAIAEQCLTKLGITGSFSLSNQFSVASFDLSGGYVDVLGRLLESECLCGWLNASDVLQVISLDQAGGTGPVIDSTQLIDLSEIGSGQLPGEAVTVSYSTVKLRPAVPTAADAVERRNWERSESVGLPTTVSVANPFFNNNPFPYAVPQFFYYNYIPRTVTTSTYDSWDRLVSRTSENYTILAELAPSYVTHVAGSAGGAISPPVGGVAYITRAITTTEYEIPASTAARPDGYERVSRETQINYEPYVKLAGSTQVYSDFGAANVVFTWNNSPNSLFIASKSETTYENTYDAEGAQISKTLTNSWQAYAYTQRGQQYLSSALSSAELFTGTAPNLSSNGTAEAILTGAAGLAYQGVSEQITVGREINLQRRPNAADRVTADLGGQTVASSSELSLAMGSPTAQRRTEFSLPHAPDDTFYKSGGTYGSIPGDAPQKAQRYGLAQNRLLLGNRSGLGLQALPEVLPSAPFAPFVLSSGGVSALYRVNALSWTFDAQGMVASCDALFWGGVGGSGPIWFPVAPGITTLPAAPGTTTVSILDGSGNVVGSYQQMVVSAVVPVWNETRKLVSRLRLRARVKSLPYPLQVVSETTIRTRVRMTVMVGTLIDVPAAAATATAQAPAIGIGTAIRLPGPAAAAAMRYAPTIATSTAVIVPALVATATAHEPEQVGRPATLVQVPAAAATATSQVPTIAAGASVTMPAASITASARVPVATADPYWSSVKLLIPMTGANNSTIFTDISGSAHAITAHGDAKISTAEYVFGGSSGLFDGNDYLTIPASSDFALPGDFTFEGWIYLPSTPSGSYAAICDSRGTNATGSDALLLAVDSNRCLKVFLDSTNLISSGGAIPLTTWTHFHVTKIGSTMAIGAAGSELATITDNNSKTQTGPLYIGRVYDNAHAGLNGRLSYLRLTKGTGRYSGSYTVPGEPP